MEVNVWVPFCAYQAGPFCVWGPVWCIWKWRVLMEGSGGRGYKRFLWNSHYWFLSDRDSGGRFWKDWGGAECEAGCSQSSGGLEGQGGVGVGWAPFAPRYTGAGQSRWAHGDQSQYTPGSGTGVRPVSQTGVRRKGEGHGVAVRTWACSAHPGSQGSSWRTSWLQERFVEALTKLTLDGCQLHSTDVLGAANTGRARRDQGAALCALSGCSPAVRPPDSQTVRPG